MVVGTEIGCDDSGTDLEADQGDGVELAAGAVANTIGGTSSNQLNVISGNTGSGVELTGTFTRNNVVEGNYIGLQSSGVESLSNQTDGVEIDSGAYSNTVGGTATGSDNVISSNRSHNSHGNLVGGDGVLITGSSTFKNYVEGNYIGTDKTGDSAYDLEGNPLGNLNDGVLIQSGANSNIIGGTSTASRNVISGNFGSGVVLTDVASNVVEGDFIGTDYTGTIALGNASNGVTVNEQATSNTIGGTSTADLNVISANGVNGVQITETGTTSNVVEGDYIGTNVQGTSALGNLEDGVLIYAGAADNTIGGSVTGSGNVLSGNLTNGVEISGAGTMSNRVEDNDIGTDKTAYYPLGNGNDDVVIDNGASSDVVGPGNVLCANTWNGVSLNDVSNCVVEGNDIGTNAASKPALGNGSDGVIVHNGATANTIGGTATGSGNVIVANGFNGVEISDSPTSGNVVEGNDIGTDANGSAGLGNSNDGVLLDNDSTETLVGGIGSTAGNVISDNGNDGVELASGTNWVEGNDIGTNAGGSKPLGNHFDGVQDDSGGDDNTIGGTTTGSGNVISSNGLQGVEFDPGVLNGYLEGNDIGTNASGASNLGNANEGVWVYGASYIFITRNTIDDNGGDGVGLNGASDIFITYNTIDNNGGYGVYGYDAQSIVVSSNTFSGNKKGDVFIQ